MGSFDWQEGHLGRDEWRSVSTTAGAPSVTTPGTTMREMWSAANWVSISVRRVSDQLFSIVGDQHFNSLTAGAIAVTGAALGAGSGPIFLDGLRCLGSEASLLHCPGSTIGIQDCQHTEDAGVYCTSQLTLSLSPLSL